jgi:MFS family permease
MAAPFFSVYMLQELRFNYFIYTMINITVAISVYFLMSRWGRHADRVGNIKVLKICAPIISTLPLYWIFCQHPAYLVLVQVLSGFAWAGFHLSASNFIYDAVSPSKRTRCIAYFNVLNGMGICLGALVGGYLVNHLPPLWGSQFFALFVFSSILRMPVALLFPRILKEVRSVEKIPSHQLFFSMVGIKPIIGIDRKTLQYGSET